MVKTILDFYIPFEIVNEGTYIINLDGKLSTLQIDLIERSKEDIKKITRETYANSGPGKFKMIRDIWGIFNFTKVRIEIPDCISLIDSLYEAQRHLSKLIRVYRYFTKKYWIPDVPDDAIIALVCQNIDDSGKRLQYGVNMGNISQRINLKKYNESMEIIDKIHEFLKTECKIPIYEELMLSSKDHYDKGQFNLSVIEMNIALESLAAEYLRNILINKGLENKIIKRMMNKYLSKKYGLNRILKEAYKKEANRSLKVEKPELWKKYDWARNCARKNAIHPWLKKLTPQEANNALSAFQEVIQWILSIDSTTSN